MVARVEVTFGAGHIRRTRGVLFGFSWCEHVWIPLVNQFDSDLQVPSICQEDA